MSMAYRCRSIPAYFAKRTLQKERGLVTVRLVIHKVIHKMAAQWKNFKNSMKEKRTNKRKAPSHDILQKEVYVI